MMQLTTATIRRIGIRYGIRFQFLWLGVVASCATGCAGGTKILKEPVAIQLVEPLATTSDQILEARLEWVIVRNGPGTWSRNAEWDEYLVTIRNETSGPVRITTVTIIDSLDEPLKTAGRRRELAAATRQTLRRYKNQDVDVEVGMGAEALMATGSAIYIAGAATAVAVLTAGATTSAAVAGTAVAAGVIGPLVLAGGMLQGFNEAQVTREIVIRQTSFPVALGPGVESNLDLFFPVAPSPKRVEIQYIDTSGTHVLTIDTRQVLRGLHFDQNADEQQ